MQIKGYLVIFVVYIYNYCLQYAKNYTIMLLQCVPFHITSSL